MSDEERVNYAELEALTVRAFLATTSFERTVEGKVVKERMSDQARRIGALVCELSFARGRDGLWVRSLTALAEALSMDKSDCTKQVRKLGEWGLLETEERDEGVWLQLCPARLTKHDRAVGAGAAFARLEREHESRQQPELLGRRLDERRDRGYQAALREADLAQACGQSVACGELEGTAPSEPGRSGERGEFPHTGRDLRRLVAQSLWGDSPPSEGRFPTACGEIPHEARGDSPQPVGRFPTGASSMSRVARAPGESLRHSLMHESLSESSDSGRRAAGEAPPQADQPGRGSGQEGRAPLRFAAADRNYMLERLEALDPVDYNRPHPVSGDPADRRRWVARVRDEPHAVERALGTIEQEVKQGKKFRSVLAVVFTETRRIVEAGGRVLKIVLFL